MCLKANSALSNMCSLNSNLEVDNLQPESQILFY